MTPKTLRLIGNIVLALAIIILGVTVVGMAGWTRKIWPSREMILVAAVLTIVARGFRRRARKLPATAPLN